MMDWLNTEGSLNEIREISEDGRTIIWYQWMNEVPLKSGDDAINVNDFRKKQ